MTAIRSARPSWRPPRRTSPGGRSWPPSTAWWRSVYRRKGEWVQPGEPVVKVLRMDSLWIEGYRRRAAATRRAISGASRSSSPSPCPAATSSFKARSSSPPTRSSRDRVPGQGREKLVNRQDARRRPHGSSADNGRRWDCRSMTIDLCELRPAHPVATLIPSPNPSHGHPG